MISTLIASSWLHFYCSMQTQNCPLRAILCLHCNCFEQGFDFQPSSHSKLPVVQEVIGIFFSAKDKCHHYHCQQGDNFEMLVILLVKVSEEVTF